MPLIRRKADVVAADAQRALAEGRTVFVCRYWDEVMSFQGTGSIAGAAQAIEDVESIGWELEQASYSWVPEKHRGVQILVFRRAR